MKQKNKENEDVIVVKEQLEIEEGKHSGKIVDMTREIRGEEGFDYTDFHISVDGIHDKNEDLNPLRVGFPTVVSKKSGLGKLLDKTGFDIEAGNKISLSDVKEKLTGKKITFLTQNKETENGTFARIIKDSIKFK